MRFHGAPEPRNVPLVFLILQEEEATTFWYLLLFFFFIPSLSPFPEFDDDTALGEGLLLLEQLEREVEEETACTGHLLLFLFCSGGGASGEG